MDRSAELRACYARYVTRLQGVKNPRVEQAFAAVPRELFVGPPPDGDLAFLYKDRLIALDDERGINNGQPSLHAGCMEALDVQEGEEILHVGAGTGYYSAILAHLAGPTGRVHAFEIDPGLARRARSNLAGWPGVDVRAC